MSLTETENQLLAEYNKISINDTEAKYRFLIKHEDELGKLSMLWEGLMAATSMEERMRIEEKLEAEGLF